VLPAATTLMPAALWSLGALLLGWLVFARYSDRIAYYV
jgi:ABC-type polysaccharide/polyol phosphate export permease